MEIRSTESILKSVRVTQLKKAAVSRLDVQFPVDQYLKVNVGVWRNKHPPLMICDP